MHTHSSHSIPSPAALPPNLATNPLSGAGAAVNPQLATFVEHLRNLGSSLQPNMASLSDLGGNASADQAPFADILETSELGAFDEAKPQAKDDLRETFQDFVGQTFFSQMIKSLRSTQKGAAYFNGGRAEEIFQGQFDQIMTEHLSDASAKSISDPMYKLFQLSRKQ